MYTIAFKRMPRPKPEGPFKTFQLRLNGEEAARWFKIWRTAKERNHYMTETDVNRRLLGLDEDKNGEVTERDRIWFQQAGKEKAKLLGRGASGKAHIKEVSPRTKRK